MSIKNTSKERLMTVNAVREYINSMFPPLYHRKKLSLWRFIEEVTSKHLVLGIITNDSTYERFVAVLEICTICTLEAFFCAVFMAIQFPMDDNSCYTIEKHNDENLCLNRKSAFDPTKSYCSYNIDNIIIYENDNNGGSIPKGPCNYQEPEIDGTTAIMIMIIILILSAIAISICGYILEHFVKAPTLEKIDDQRGIKLNLCQRIWRYIGGSVTVKGIKYLSQEKLIKNYNNDNDNTTTTNNNKPMIPNSEDEFVKSRTHTDVALLYPSIAVSDEIIEYRSKLNPDTLHQMRMFQNITFNDPHDITKKKL
jgi:hypothetical protein